MQTISGKGIREAAVHGKQYFNFYDSPIKTDKATGFAIEFETFGDLASFLVNLGANASADENNHYSTTLPEIDSDDARALANSLEVDPFGINGLLAFFPDWELT